jgi:nitrite reductase (NADH) large subunit
MTALRIVVVGGGFAGASVARALVERAAPGALRIDLLEREPGGACDRFELLRALRGEVPVSSRPRFDPSWLVERGLSYHVGTTVHLIDRPRRVVQATGMALPYDRLILATGCSPYLPSIRGLLRADGSLPPRIFTLHTLRDGEAASVALASARRVAVLGGGAFGIEVVEALCRRGLEVHLFQLGARLMSSELDDAAASLLQAKLAAAGAEVHLQARAVALESRPSSLALGFRDGSELEFDVVLLAAGVQPDTWLAYQCGLSVERGIVVEGRLRSLDDFSVHALGECAQWRGRVYALPEQIAEQAQVIAEHILDPHSPRRYHGLRQAALYQVMGMNVTTLGRPEARLDEDVVQLQEPSRSRYKKVVLRDGRLVGAILIGDVRHASSLSRLYDSNARLPREAQHRLFDLAVPADQRESVLPPPSPSKSDDEGI